MKRVTKTEEGYLLNEYQARQIKKHSLKMFRSSLLNLVHIGTLSFKEKADIEFFADQIFYKDILKGIGKTPEERKGKSTFALELGKAYLKEDEKEVKE